MQDSRLFRIVYYLLDKGRCTAPELAEKLEVSVRTIYPREIYPSSANCVEPGKRKTILRCQDEPFSPGSIEK